MKVDLRIIGVTIFSIIISILIGLSLFGCQDAKLAQYHYKKAVKHGYRCDTVFDTIEVSHVDSFPVIVNDTIVWRYYITKRDTVVKYQTSYIPKTRWQTRIEYKHDRRRFNALLKQNRYIISQTQRNVLKTAKLNSKQNPLRQLKSLIVWATVLIIAFFALNWVRNK